jgi:hypothetical protein
MAQSLKYKLTLEISKVNKPTDVFSDPANPATRRVEEGLEVTRKEIESDSITELKSALADFRSNLRES